MRLQLDFLFIRDVQFAFETTIRDGVLHVDKGALQALLLEDRRFASVDVEIAHPGEECRITGVLDVIEPRAKTSDGDEDFPGAVGTQVPAGTGEHVRAQGHRNCPQRLQGKNRIRQKRGPKRRHHRYGGSGR